MAFNLSYQLKNKSWWIDVVLYLVCALLIAAVFCYFIFAFKVYLQTQKNNEIDNKIAAYDTSEQKAYEKKVFDYKKKIDDFTVIVKNHKISSNIFSFIEERTLPNVWFSDFNMFDASGSTNKINLSGESENMKTLSRQVQVFEKSEDYIKNISVLNSEASPTGTVKFVLNLSLDPKIFTYKPFYPASVNRPTD